MPDALLSSPPQAAAPRRFGWQRFGGKFLVISVAAHVLLLTLAGYYVVQRYGPPAKRNFTPPGKGPNAPTRALEHKVQQKKQKAAMSAPPSAKRVTTAGVSKVSLPAMPAMPGLATSLSPASISGMGAGALAPGALGAGAPSGMGGSGGGGVNFFGARTGGNGLTGTLYDLKQNTARQPTNMDPKEFGKVLGDFVKGGFNLGLLARYFKSPKPIYNTQIFIPQIDANLGPAAFQLEKEVQPKMWLVHYKGSVIAPEDGTFYFVGAGDDVLLVKFNNRFVLDGCWYDITDFRPTARYLGYGNKDKGLMRGTPFTVQAGETYPIEVVIGEQPGGKMSAALLIEKQGVEYKKDANGNPILPVFRMANAAPLGKGAFPPHENGGPIWKAAQLKPSSSIFDR